VVQLTGDSSFTPRLRTAASADSVDVLVVVEEGFAPHRVAQTAVFGGDHGNNTWDADGLTRSILDASAGDARGGAFGLGQWQGGGWLWGRRAGIDALAGDPGTTLAIAWPVLAGALGVATGPIRVDSMATGSLVIGDLGRSLEADYRRALPSIVGRVAARAVARQAALSAIRGKNGKRRTAAAVFAVAAAAIDLADTRSWSVLPARVGVLPIRVPSGARQIVISGGGRTTAVPLTLGGPRLRLAHWRLFDGESTPVAVASTGGTIATGLPR
jgi:hypothetical protein